MKVDILLLLILILLSMEIFFKTSETHFTAHLTHEVGMWLKAKTTVLYFKPPR